MSYQTIAAGFTREPFAFIEVDAPAGLYRFCTPRELIPVGLDAIPCLKSEPVTSPAEVDPNGGPGIRASVSCQLAGFADTDGAEYWPQWRSLNKFYEGARLSVFTGFVEGDAFDLANFTRRDYVIERFGISRTGGATMTGKDPLKLAANNKAQIPSQSRGALLAALAPGDTSATLQPAGIGATYAASGFVKVRGEVMGYTRSGDVLTLTRAQYNTAAGTHSAGDSVQLCAVLSGSAPDLARLILQAAGIPDQYIPIEAWRSEASAYLPGLYSTILTEPTGATLLLKELGEQAPHLLFWDDSANVIQFVAVKPPPTSARELNWRDHIIADSFDADDDPAARVTRVFIYFGQVDPTKRIDDPSNYRQTFVRVDPQAESDYGGPSIKTIYSRWISTVNKAAAIRASARIGRRAYNTPRRVSFALDVKDRDVWTGAAVRVDHPMLYEPADVQILSAAEKGTRIQYRGLEYLYGPGVPEDADADATGKLIVLSGELQNLNLRSVFDSIYPSYDPGDDVRFIFDAAAVVGSASTSARAVLTGTWPGLITPPLIDMRGLTLGAGGEGAAANSADPGENGGIAIELQGPIRLNNTGTIGGGAGGGGRATLAGADPVAGGGGAGFTPGAAGLGSGAVDQLANPGDKLTGGAGGENSTIDGGALETARGGRGGDIGQPGQAGSSTDGNGTPGGLAGLAIKRNGFTITTIGAGLGNTPGGVD